MNCNLQACIFRKNKMLFSLFTGYKKSCPEKDSFYFLNEWIMLQHKG